MKRVDFRVERRHGPGALERLAAMLNRALEDPAHPAGVMQWEIAGDEGFIRCQFSLGPEPQAKADLCGQVGRVLADFTLSEKEPQMLRHYFQVKQGRDDPVELDALIAETVSLLDGEPESNPSLTGRGREKRLGRLAGRFAAYLAEHDRIHVDGFLRFRVPEYRREVLEAADAVMEEKRMDRQYEEFMSLLKTLVDGQQTGIPEVHVLHAGGHAFRLLDEDMRPLEKGGLPWECTGEEDGEDSILVSRLLAVSPGQVHIHTPEPDSQVIRTLIGIFGDRAALYPHRP